MQILNCYLHEELNSKEDGTLVSWKLWFMRFIWGMCHPTGAAERNSGSIFISGKPVSIARRVYEVVASVIIRESGF